MTRGGGEGEYSNTHIRVRVLGPAVCILELIVFGRFNYSKCIWHQRDTACQKANKPGIKKYPSPLVYKNMENDKMFTVSVLTCTPL